MLKFLLIAQAGLVPPDRPSRAEPAKPEPKLSVISVDRITVNLIVKRDEETGQEFRQCYVSFWNRSRYTAATGVAFPLWENRGWRIWTPECGPYRASGEHLEWACVFEPEGLIVEAREYVYWVSDYDVESQWPACVWRRPIK